MKLSVIQLKELSSNMSQRLLQLTQSLKNPQGLVAAEAGQDVIEVSGAATTAATIYEKVRTVVDYQEEHLLRRNAIARIFKRYLGSDVPLEDMAENLLQELIWAKYLPNQQVPTSLVKKLTPIIKKYEALLHATDNFGGRKDWAFQWVLDILATEIEYAIAPPVTDEALVSYMYEEMRQRVMWDPDIPLKDEDKDLLLYIAIHKDLLKSNLATLRFRVLTLYYPEWPGAVNEEYSEKIAKHLDTVIETIEKQLTHPVMIKLSLLLRRKTGVFHVIADVIQNDPAEFPILLQDPEKLDAAVARALTKRTKDFRVRLRRTVIRSVMFLFLTKMLLALILELPYDLWIMHQSNWVPLGINIIFHPLFLAFIALTVSIKEHKNKKDYRAAVRALVVGADQEFLNVHVKRESFSAWSKIFDVVYAITFIFTYGLIGTFLYNIGFNWLSITLFLFFLSLVTFFGIRIRTSTKDIVLSGARSSLPGTLFDIFMLPLVRAGRWLSVKVAKINVFIYFFDFIIEAPLKVAIRFVESWLAFVREKKDEI